MVLWVLNGNHLGQADVEDAVSQMAKLGKPILGIVNRIDKVDTDPICLVNYVRQRIGMYFAEIFPLSSYMAFEAVMSDNAVGAVVRVIGLKKQKDKCKEDIR